MSRSAIIFSSCAFLCKNNGGFQRKGVMQSCSKYGAYNCLTRDLEVHAEDKLKYYIHMDLSAFEELFSLVE